MGIQGTRLAPAPRALRGSLVALLLASCGDPIGIAPPGDWTAVSTGVSHTCALTRAALAYCWGGNFSGQLGDGTQTDRSEPTPVAGGLTFTAISAGGGLTCAITPDGAAYCWGRNFSGQLGDGTQTDRSEPTPVVGDLVFRTVSAGEGYACAVTTADVAYCWGDNRVSQLGDRTTVTKPTPSAVAGGLAFRHVTAGFHFESSSPFTVYRNFTCGLTTSGAAYCWGGSISDRGTVSSSAEPVPENAGQVFQLVSRKALALSNEGTPYDLFTDQVLESTRAYRTATAAGHFACGVTAENAAYCGGLNDAGELGNGTLTSSDTWTPVSGRLPFSVVDAGGSGRERFGGSLSSGYACGLSTTGALYCWGSNTAGQLGDGTTTNRTVPTLVASPP